MNSKIWMAALGLSIACGEKEEELIPLLTGTVSPIIQSTICRVSLLVIKPLPLISTTHFGPIFQAIRMPTVAMWSVI